MVTLQRLADTFRQLTVVVLLLFGATVVSAANCVTQLEKNENGRLARFGRAAIVIGISNPRMFEGPHPLPSATKEADIVGQYFAKQDGYRNHVYSLVNGEATAANIQLCLDGVAKNSAKGSSVVVFISARGFASDAMNDGYIVTSDAALDKVPATRAETEKLKRWPGGNGISLSTLKRKVGLISPEGARYLFLDLCRDPEEVPKLDNKIYGRILKQEFYDGSATKRIILASNGTERSLPTHFAGSLVEVIPPEREPFQVFFDKLKARVVQKSRGQQTPSGPPVTTEDSCLLCRTALPGPLLASAAPMASFAEQDLPEVPAGALAGRIKAARAEDEGQAVFVRYGEGNHFSGDPLAQCEKPDPVFRAVKLCAEDFSRAAEQFRLALKEYPMGAFGDAEGDKLAKESLEERLLFSQAQSLLLRGQRKEAQKTLLDGAPFGFSESYNVLGITYLEDGNYSQAAEQFREAIARAPHWGYPRHNLALTLTEQGNYTEAERVYREAIAATPVGKKFRDMENSCFGKREVLVTARPYLYYNLGVLLQRVNRLGEARTQFCLAEASFRLSVALLQAESPDELAEKRAMAAVRNLADVKNSQGVLWQMRGKRKQAEREFERAMAAYPGLLAARFNLGRVREKTRPDQARELFKGILEDAGCKARADLSCAAAEKALARLR